MRWPFRRGRGRHAARRGRAAVVPTFWRPVVRLGFTDGSEVTLDPGAPATRALLIVAATLTSRDDTP